MNGGRILIVEDERVVARDLEVTLSDLGFTVTGLASCGEDALALAGETNPDLVLMDIRLAGELDGIETARHLRDRWDIPVVYITAHSDDDVIQRAKVTEPLGYIIKPFDSRMLYGTVEMALYRREAARMTERGRQWMSEWRADMERVLASVEAADAPPDAAFVPVSTFVALTVRNIVSALSNIQQLTDAMAERTSSPDACHLMQCPRRTVLEDALRDAVATLEQTRGAFKSRELGTLRRRLETLLDRSTGHATPGGAPL